MVVDDPGLNLGGQFNKILYHCRARVVGSQEYCMVLLVDARRRNSLEVDRICRRQHPDGNDRDSFSHDIQLLLLI
jgi:hypothetical protein